MSGILKNAKHEHFAMLIAKGETATKAATLAGYSEKTARKQGSRLLTKADIAARVEALRIGLTERAVAVTTLTRAYILEKLHENVKRALQQEPVRDSAGKPTGQFRYDGNVANRALELIGKELGMFVERKQITIEDLRELSTEELLALMEDVNGRLSKASESEKGAIH